jgi:hypothetical protein
MRIDNSRAKAFFNCPAFYQERYMFKIEPKSKQSYGFGSRWHQLLEERHRRMKGEDFTAPPCADEEIENEARAMLARYEAHYPEEPFEIITVEQFFEVPLPGDKHTYIGEFDGIVRDKETGLLQLFETKSERRGSKANLPDPWAARSQVGLYLWAAEQMYKEPFKNILLNVCTRQSPAGREPASFRRDPLQRSEKEKADAVSNIIWVADQISELERTYDPSELWPQNRNNCVNDVTNWRCDYHPLHVVARGERDEQLVQIKYQDAEEYLAL